MRWATSPRTCGRSPASRAGQRRLPAADAAPHVVFITASDEHALKALELQAIDYLLKPFAPSRFRLVLERVRRQLAGPAPADLGQRLERLLDAVRPASRYPRQIMVDKGHGRSVLVSVDRVVAERNDHRFVPRSVDVTPDGTMAAAQPTLGPEKFVRIDRTGIVRLDAVAGFQPWSHDDSRAR